MTDLESVHETDRLLDALGARHNLPDDRDAVASLLAVWAHEIDEGVPAAAVSPRRGRVAKRLAAGTLVAAFVTSGASVAAALTGAQVPLLTPVGQTLVSIVPGGEQMFVVDDDERPDGPEDVVPAAPESEPTQPEQPQEPAPVVPTSDVADVVPAQGPDGPRMSSDRGIHLGRVLTGTPGGPGPDVGEVRPPSAPPEVRPGPPEGTPDPPPGEPGQPGPPPGTPNPPPGEPGQPGPPPDTPNPPPGEPAQPGPPSDTPTPPPSQPDPPPSEPAP